MTKRLNKVNDGGVNCDSVELGIGGGELPGKPSSSDLATVTHIGCVYSSYRILQKIYDE